MTQLMESIPPVEFRAGTVGLLGRPNVGKSSLMNALIGMKISITSRKPQTTRHNIRGIVNNEDTQAIFVDTPGYQTVHRNALNSAMNRNLRRAQDEIDVALLVLEAGVWEKDDEAILERLKTSGSPILVAVNKSDKIGPDKMLPYLDRISRLADMVAIVPTSARKKKGLTTLLRAIREHLPAQAAIYPVEQITDRSERFLVAEILREKLFRQLGDELPYGLTTTVEKFETKGRLAVIQAEVLVDKEPHRAIILGKQGQAMKKIATDARKDMQVLLRKKVHLEVWIKVRSGWADDVKALRQLGYE